MFVHWGEQPFFFLILVFFLGGYIQIVLKRILKSETGTNSFLLNPFFCSISSISFVICVCDAILRFISAFRILNNNLFYTLYSYSFTLFAFLQFCFSKHLSLCILSNFSLFSRSRCRPSRVPAPGTISAATLVFPLSRLRASTST